MSTAQVTPTLAQAVRAKYPGVYDDMDDVTLENKVLAKYPQYSDMPRTKPQATQPPEQPKQGFLGALGSDVGQMVTGLPSMFRGMFDPGTVAQRGAAMFQADQNRQQNGAKLPYRVGAEIAQAAGSNVPGMEQSAAQGDVGGVLGHAATAPLLYGILRGGSALGRAGLEALPSKVRAGENFAAVKSAAGNIPIDLTAPGNTALETQNLASRGGSMPKVVRDFIKRATDPNQPPLTYSEARDFYSNASRISADEAQRLTPVMRRQLGKFTQDLGNSIKGAANQGGALPQYQSAMSEYAKASKLGDALDSAGSWLTKEAMQKLPWLASGYMAKKIYDATK